MNEIIKIVEEYKSEIFDEKVYLYPNFPKKKLKNALNAYVELDEDEIVLVLIDDTTFGRADNGLVITNQAIYAKQLLADEQYCFIEFIENMKVSGMINKDFIIDDDINIKLTEPKKKSIKLLIEMLREIQIIIVERNEVFDEDISIDNYSDEDQIKENLKALKSYVSNREEDNNEIENKRNFERNMTNKGVASSSSINLFIKENVQSVGNHVYVNPEIPEKKLNNAIQSFKCEDFYESILAIYDDTLLGSAKEGLIFTGKKMLHHQYGEFIYSEIDVVEYIENIIVDDKGKEKKDEFIIIKTKDNKESKLKHGLSSIDKKKFADFLNIIITEFEDYEEENQLKTISKMSDELKIAYLKIIINMTFVDDEEIDAKELAELFLLMTRLELNKESRFIVRAYITEISKDHIESVESQLKIVENNSEASHYKSLMISLAKDLINVYFSTNNTINRNFKFLDEYQNIFELSDVEIDLAYDTVENDYKLLKENLDDDAITKNAKELASKAAAAGAPLAAVYISGSVVGMSAAGITSGLATLGMGMGMTGGLAVIGIIGVLSYKGVKHLTGANELDKYKTRELMLHDVIKQTQKTISLIIDDVNYIVQKLNDTILNHGEQTEKIKKLTHMIAQFQGALKSVDNKSNTYQNSVHRIHCPRILDDKRLKSLTHEPTKKALYDFIIVNYEKESGAVFTGKGNTDEDLILKDNISTEILDKMAEIFNVLGYFSMDNIIKSKASGMIKGVFG